MRRRPARGSYTPNQSDYLSERYDGMQLEDSCTVFRLRCVSVCIVMLLLLIHDTVE